MGKAWDILPPIQKPKKKLTKAAKKRKERKNITLFLWVVFLTIIGFMAVSFAQHLPNGEGNIAPVATTNPPTNTPTTPNKTTTPTPTLKNKQDLTIKVLNGSGQSEELDKVNQLITDQGFVASKTENALNLYETTIIYFQESQKKYASELADTLTLYKPQTKPFTQETSYDLIIVIGPR